MSVVLLHHLEASSRYAGAGFDRVDVHQVGPDQAGFFDSYASHILPRSRDGHLEPGGPFIRQMESLGEGLSGSSGLVGLPLVGPVARRPVLPCLPPWLRRAAVPGPRSAAPQAPARVRA